MKRAGLRPQLELVDERQAVQIRGRPDLSGIDAFTAEEVLVVRHRFRCVPHGVAHALVPTGQELFAWKVRGLSLTRHVPEHGQRPVTLLEEVHSDPHHLDNHLQQNIMRSETRRL